jgi:glycosyltransferase involved in cell wall biosynthesis
MTGVHQVLAGAAPRDAITNHVMAARDVIRGMGLRSEVFVEARHRDASLADECHAFQEWERRTGPGDVAIVHYSIDSPAFAHVARHAESLAIHYHNITPPQLLWRYAPGLARQCAQGRERLAALVPRAAAFAADSTFNARELQALGADEISVVGILRPERPAPQGVGGRHGGELRVLFVGRGVPNKAQDELILAAAALRQAGVPARLRLVGAWGGARSFEQRCRYLVDRVGAEPYVDVLGSIDDDALANEYAQAVVFASASHHEGYCVPVMEAMEARLPVAARAAGAVPETLGGAGVLLDDPAPSEMAEGILAAASAVGATTMEEARRCQLAHHSRAATAARLVTFVKGLI